jgi:hypothetical protein
MNVDRRLHRNAKEVLEPIGNSTTVIIHGVPPRRATGRIERSPESQEAPSYREHPRRTPKKRGGNLEARLMPTEIEKALGGGVSLEPLRGFLCFESARVSLRGHSQKILTVSLATRKGRIIESF